MRRSGKGIIAALLVTVMLFCITACGGLSGTYYAEESGITVELTFDNGNLTMSMGGMDVHGTYKVEGDKITMTMNVFGQDSSNTVDFKQEGNSIFIEGVEYKKK